MKTWKLAGGGLLIASGIAIACTTKPMPPLKVDVSLWDIAVAWFQGASNPSSAAFLSNLDEMASFALGADNWRANNYVGYVYPATSVAGMTGVTQIFIDKPCDSTAVDGASNSSASSNPAAGVNPNGAGQWNPPLPPKDCYGECGVVEVGDLKSV